MPQMLNCKDKTEGITLSTDLFTAETADLCSGSVRAVEPVLKQDGVYFYEVKLLSDTSMQIGWGTKKCFLDSISLRNAIGVRKDEESISIDGFRKKVLQNREFDITDSNMKNWKSGDILGCLINITKKKFDFYLNGRKVAKDYDHSYRRHNEFKFSNLPYYPAASLSANSEIFFNFGQQPFEYPPKDIPFCDFYGYQFNKFFQRLDPFSISGSKVVLSCDLLSARDPAEAQNHFNTFEALQSISSGTYFYEVHLLTDGSMKIGWKSEQYTNSNYESRNSMDIFIYPIWITFDGYRKLIWNSDKQFDIDGSCWKKGDVVGCLINIKEKNFAFYLNGKEYDIAKLGIKVDILNENFYPSIALTAGQQVYCNFGQEPFQFAPKGIEFKDFYGNEFN